MTQKVRTPEIKYMLHHTEFVTLIASKKYISYFMDFLHVLFCSGK